MPDTDDPFIQWRCRFMVTETERCTFAAEDGGLCFLHRTKTSTTTALATAAQVAGVLNFLCKLLEWYHGQGDGIVVASSTAAAIEQLSLAVRNGDKDRVSEILAAAAVHAGRLWADGLTMAMVRNVSVHVKRTDAESEDEWLARTVAALPDDVVNALKGSGWDPATT